MLRLAFLLFVAPLGAHALQLVTADDPPHNMQTRDGSVIGSVTEKLQEAMQRSSIPYQIEFLPWARAYTYGLERPQHCVFSAARTPEREALFKWVGPVARIDWVLYALAGHKKPAHLEQLKGESIGGGVKNVTADWLSQHGYRVDYAVSEDALIRKLLNGRIKYWASSNVRGNAYLKRYNLQQRIVPALVINHTDLYLACNKSADDATIAKLNEALRQMNQDGTSARIEARYAK